MPDLDTDITPSSEDIPSRFAPPPIPGSGQAAPPPVLLANGFGAVVDQPWATARRVYPITLSPGRFAERNQVSEYRTGEIIFDAGGVTLQGKAVLPVGTRTLFLLLGLLIGVGWLVVYLILEYGVRNNRTDRLSWDCIEGITLQPKKRRICIGYHLPDKPKKSFGLGIKLPADLYDDFVNSAQEYLPGRVVEGKILSITPKYVYWILGGFVIFLIGLMIWASVSH